MQQTLIFIHGVGGAPKQDDWLDPLSQAIIHTGHSRPEQSAVGIVTVRYVNSLISHEGGAGPAATWKKSPATEEAFTNHVRNAVHTASMLRRHRHEPPLVRLGDLPGDMGEALHPLIETSVEVLRKEAGRYRRDHRTRAAVQRSVLRQLPTKGRVVIVAHSLGSVIALDLLKRLDPRVHVDLLLTLGSPLSLETFREGRDTSSSSFPYDRVGSWVNVFDSRDPVTNGRGVARWYSMALDAEVNLGSYRGMFTAINHTTAAYLSLPLVGELVGYSLHGPAARASGEPVPARQIDEAWYLHLLAAAYADQISQSCDPRKWSWKRRFDSARLASVVKLLDSMADQQGGSGGNADQLSRALDSTPTLTDFLDHAAGLVHGSWNDAELLTFAVGLFMGSPVRPFEFEISPEHCERALTQVLNRVRNPGQRLSDQAFAKAVRDAYTQARKDMDTDPGALWPWLVGAGLVVIAATGVGVFVALPAAGLAGAALITSTLAALGPGGMVGGMVTLAMGASLGTGLISAGLAMPEDERFRVVEALSQSLAAMTPQALESALVGAISVVRAQETLGFDSSVPAFRELLSAVLADVANEKNAHRRLESKEAKIWDKKLSLVERALKVLNQVGADPVATLAIEAIKRSEHSLTLPTNADRYLPQREEEKPPNELHTGPDDTGS